MSRYQVQFQKGMSLQQFLREFGFARPHHGPAMNPPQIALNFPID
jgi:hypothetical protein